MSQLNLSLLGSPVALHAAQPVSFRTKKSLALLIYLAVEGGIHARNQLAMLLWPEHTDSQARAALRGVLAQLRRSLSYADPADHLVTESDQIGIDQQNVTLDLHILAAAYQHTLNTGVAATDRAARLEQFQAALDAYRGDFLAGFALDNAPDFDDWISARQAAYQRQMSHVLDHFSRQLIDEGAIGQALDVAQRWLEHEPLSEAAYRRMIELYLARGDRTAALQVYESCRVRLADELGIEPASEMIALAERIRSMDRPAPIDGRTRSHSTALSIAAPPIITPPLMGRTSEYAALIAAYRTMAQGVLQVVAIVGESGIGKTRLADEFLGWVTAQGGDVLYGRAIESSTMLSYQLVIDALRRRLEQERAPDDLLSDVWLTELSRLLPEIHERYPDLALPIGDEPSARTRLFEAIARLLHALAEHKPVVFFLDDLHWADAASLDLLNYVCQRSAEHVPLLFLLALRSDATHTLSERPTWLAALQRTTPITQLSLASLSAETVAQMIATLAGAEHDHAPDGSQPGYAPRSLQLFSDWLFVETSGQPFYIVETIKTLMEQGLLTWRLRPDGSWSLELGSAVQHMDRLQNFLPLGVRELIHARIQQLSPHAKDLAVAGAVLGYRASFEQLCRVADLSERDGLAALDELIHQHILHQAAGSPFTSRPDCYIFEHDKIRDVVYAEASPTRRRVFHHRALTALDRVTPAELAHHALAAGLAQEALQYSLEAGDCALSIFAISDAISHYERARQILAEGHLPTISTVQIRQLFGQLGRAYELSNQIAQADATYQELLSFARKTQRPALESAALNRLAMLVSQNERDLERASALLEVALDVARESSDLLELAETEWSLAQINFYRFDPTAAIAHGEQALALARQLELPDLLARSLNVLAYAKSTIGCWDGTISHAQEARLLHANQGNYALEADSLSLVSTALISSGRLPDGLSAARAAFVISQQIDNRWGQAHSAFGLTMALIEAGAYAEGLALAQHGVATARTLKFPQLLFLNLMGLGWIQRELHAFDQARVLHTEALALSQQMGQRLYADFANAALCANFALDGSWAEASYHARQALDQRDYRLRVFLGACRWLEIQALLRSGEIDRASEDLRLFGQRFGTSPRHRIDYLRASAVLALHHGAIEQARTGLHEAAELAAALGLRGVRWQILAALSELYLNENDEDRALQMAGQSAAIVHQLAAQLADPELAATFLGGPAVQRILEMPQVLMLSS